MAAAREPISSSREIFSLVRITSYNVCYTKLLRYLEDSYGALCELALDLAIDKNGKIFILEVNPKPAREVFIQSGDPEAYHRSIVRPLEYALWVYKHKVAPSFV